MYVVARRRTTSDTIEKPVWPTSRRRPWPRLVWAAWLVCWLAPLAGAQPLRDALLLADWRFQPGRLGAEPVAAEWVPVRLPYVWSHTWTRPRAADGTGWAKLDLADLDSGWYETEVAPPAGWQGRRLVLELRGVQADAKVFVDGQAVGEVAGPDGQVDLTAALTAGRRAVLRLWVTRWWAGLNHARAQDPLRDRTIRALTGSEWFATEDQVRRGLPAGISDGVSLLAGPAAATVTGVGVQTSVRRGELRVSLDYRLAQPLPGARWQVQVTELDGRAAGLPSLTVPLAVTAAGEAPTQTLVLPWAQPRLWEVGDGYLYRLEVRLLDADGRVIDQPSPVRFGFREVWTAGRDLMLNGHPLRLRLGYFTATVQQMHFFAGMGFNAMEFQPNPTGWYGPWGLFPGEGLQAGTRALLDAADERGWAVLMPVPGVSHLRDALLQPEIEALYRRDVRTWLSKLDRRNRPSILMWTPSMNTQGYPDPSGLGRPPSGPPPAWFAKVDGMLHELDPTRLVFHHQGGQTGDMETANLYLNFVPLAEQEDWLSDWSAHGQKPWAGIEHMSPVSLDFFKGGEAWFTEYAAIYLGDRAYALERDEYAAAAARGRQRAKGPRAEDLAGAWSVNGDLAQVGEWTGYYELTALFVRAVNRAWRAYGLNGGCFPWLFDVGFGRPPGYQPKFNHWWLYEDLPGTPEQLAQRPAWANPLYDAYHDTMQPLLCYLGGPAAHFTAREPRYRSGEVAERSLIAVWDGPGRAAVNAEWSLSLGGRVLQRGTETLDLGPGDIVKRPLRFTVPTVAQRTDAELKLTVRRAGQTVSNDTVALACFPPEPPVKLTARWGLYDPAGLAGEWAKLGLTARAVGLGEKLDDLDVLVIGPRALTHDGDLPFDEADLRRGLRVLILEQTMDGLARFGFHTLDSRSRYVFRRVKEHAALAGLTDADLANWRGSGTLLPETDEGMKRWEPSHGPHWGNVGTVASVVIETPTEFTPLADCEFDLAYSPLLSLRCGAGEVVWSQFDLRGRLGAEPTADKLATNLLRYLDAPLRPLAMKMVWLGDEPHDDATLDPRREFARYSAGSPDLIRLAEAFVRRGGTAYLWPSNSLPAAISALPLPWKLPLEERTATRVEPAKMGHHRLLAGVSPALVNWRRPITGWAFAAEGLPPGAVRLLDGFLLVVPQGQGRWVICTLPWEQFNKEGVGRRAAPPDIRLDGLLERNLGRTVVTAGVAQGLGRRACALMRPVRQWQVQAGETAAWRLGGSASGELHLPAGGRAVAWVYSSREREAAVGIRSSGPLQLRINGQNLLINAAMGDAEPAPLAAGWNKVELHVAGPGGHVVLRLSDPGDLRVSPTSERPTWAPPPSPPAHLRPEPRVAYDPFDLGAELDGGQADPYAFTAW